MLANTKLCGSLEQLDLAHNQSTGMGCAALVAAIDSGQLPGLREISLIGNPASVLAQAEVVASIRRSNGEA